MTRLLHRALFSISLGCAFTLPCTVAAQRGEASRSTTPLFPPADSVELLVSRTELLHHIWGPTDREETSYLRVYLGQLRHKLERDPAQPQHLITEAGMGYRFRT